MALTHAVMQRWHYQAARDHIEYRLSGLLDCEAEIQSLNTPIAFDPSDLEDRLNNLEAITAEPGGIPRWYHDQIQQLHREIAHLRGKIIDKPPVKRPAPKTGYQGLSVAN